MLWYIFVVDACLFLCFI